jgi:hypothetical protein
MRKMTLAAAAALLLVGGVAFQAKATIGVGTEDLSERASSYSLVTKAGCNSQGSVVQFASVYRVLRHR